MVIRGLVQRTLLTAVRALAGRPSLAAADVPVDGKDDASDCARTPRIIPKPVVPPPSPADIQPLPCDIYDGQVKRVTFIYDADGHDKVLQNLTLIGSWDRNSKRYATDWDKSAVPMVKDETGRWQATVEVLNDKPHAWQWNVLGDGPFGNQQSVIFDEGVPNGAPWAANLAFNPAGRNLVNVYAPTTYTRMGATRQGDDVSFQYWAPNARQVQAKIFTDVSPTKDLTRSSEGELVPLTRDPVTGMWSGALPGGWARSARKPYAYQVLTREGQMVLRADPYARERQGQQRGISQFYLHAESGAEVNRYYVDPKLQQSNQPSTVQFIRFEVQGHSQASQVHLVLRDENGKVFDRDRLTQRLGAGQAELVRKYHGGKFSDFWSDNIDAQGHIPLVKQGNAWACVLNNPPRLDGLSYVFEVHEPDLLGDTDHDGHLSAAEARGTAFNDPYSSRIDGTSYGWERFGLVGQPEFQWRYDDAPRMATDRSRMIVYQIHAGSFMGSAKNVSRSTFKEIQQQLSYLKDLGANTIELLPVNSQEGCRDWGYLGNNSLALTDQYGYEDDNGRWVGGLEAFKRLVDECHRMGFNIVNDVVYNHWGLDYNDMWNTDGTKNPYFDWGTDPKNPNPVERNNQFGPLPAFNKTAPRQFIVDSASVQTDELHVDGERHDFTHPEHDASGGGGDGWTLLRKINRELHFFHPKVWTNAEEFPNSEIVTEPARPQMQGGGAFDTEWDTEFQHRLVHDNDNPSILQQAVNGQYTNIDTFMNHLINHPGFKDNTRRTTIISDHDEVGNASRTLTVAMGGREDILPTLWARSACRLTFGVGMLSPGTPLFFQGEESLARNRFTWGVPSTWDVGWEWREVGRDWDFQNTQFGTILNRFNPPAVPPAALPDKQLTASDQRVLDCMTALQGEERDQYLYNVMRKLHFNFSRDVIALRQSSRAFDGDAEAARVYTHNDNSVMAFSRKKDGEEYLVVASLNHSHQANVNIAVDGTWELVLDSNAEKYGGDGWGGKTRVAGGQNATFDIPSAGLLVYKRVAA